MVASRRSGADVVTAQNHSGQMRVTAFIASVVPKIMAAAAIGIALNCIGQWYVRPDAIGPILPVLSISVPLMFVLSYLVHLAAIRGHIDVTGLLGVVYVAIVASTLALITYEIGGGVRYALSYSALLACISAFFWPRVWHFIIGTIVALAPSCVLLAIVQESRDIRITGMVFVLNSFLISIGTYWIVRKGNDRIASLTKEIEFRASHDSLTGLMNRGYWMTQADQLLRICGRSGRTASVMVVDVDHFKQINDEEGHEAGDRFLVAVAEVLAGVPAIGSIVGRLGGDEFVILLPGISLQEAEQISATLHRDLRALSYERRALTFSIGVAEWDRQQTLPELIAQADAAMFAAKRDGRGTTRSAPYRSFGIASNYSPPAALGHAPQLKP